MSLNTDFDVQMMDRKAMKAEILKLRKGIRDFLGKEGQDWCWENYNDLGKLLPEQLVPQPPKVDPLDAMEGCVRYWKMIGGQCPKATLPIKST